MSFIKHIWSLLARYCSTFYRTCYSTWFIRTYKIWLVICVGAMHSSPIMRKTAKPYVLFDRIRRALNSVTLRAYFNEHTQTVCSRVHVKTACSLLPDKCEERVLLPEFADLYKINFWWELTRLLLMQRSKLFWPIFFSHQSDWCALQISCSLEVRSKLSLIKPS